MDRYVLGLAFGKKYDTILLMEKTHPEWQKGFLNGVGGMIKDDESTIDAMNRECLEETGLSLTWTCKGIMRGRNDDKHLFKCHFFYAYSDIIHNYEQIEDEPLGIYDLKDLLSTQVMSALNFLIPFGIYNDRDIFMTLDYQSVFKTS